MSVLFKPTTIKGTRLTDFSGTSAEVGKAIPFGYGTFPVDGFIGWAPLPPVEHRKVKRQGKGGVKQETFTYTLSYAVFFCKGPIYGIKWIKRNGKVVYTTDPNAPIEDREYATKWAQRVNFHWGTRDQLPDSLIESYEGVGNVSGFPGMFYITVEDEDVTDTGGAPPNYEACVVATPPEAYLTSKPYPIYVRDDLSMSGGFADAETKDLFNFGSADTDAMTLSAGFVSASTKEVLLNNTIPPESLSFTAGFVSASTKEVLLNNTIPPESLSFTAGFDSASTKEVVLSNSIPPESLSFSASFISASTEPA